MADTFTVVTQNPGLDTVGGQQTQDVVFVGITTKPHGTFVEFPIPQAVYSAQQVNDYSIGFSETVEAVWANQWVTGVEWSQRVNPSNLLESVLTITVTSSTQNSSSNIVLPESQWAPSFWNPLINNLHDELEAAENL